MGLGVDFRRLWLAYGTSEAGSAVGSGALPLVAVLVLHTGAFRVSLLAALAGWPPRCSGCRPARGSSSTANGLR